MSQLLVTPPPVECTPPPSLFIDGQEEQTDGVTGQEARHQRERFDGVASLLFSATIHLVLLLIMTLMVKSSFSDSRIVMEFSSVNDADDPMAFEVLDFSDAGPSALRDSREDFSTDEFQTFEGIGKLDVELPDLKLRPVSFSSGRLDEVESPEEKKSNQKQQGVKFFGTHAYGSKFVYVLDVSGSMASGSGGRMGRARVELVRSINDLQPHHSFYVVLYNNSAVKMFGERAPARLRPATRQNKSQVERWITSVRPLGGTFPAGALKIAGDLLPDAVFFLSDGEFVYTAEPGMASTLDRFMQGFGQARPSNLRGRLIHSLLSPKAVLDQYAPEIVVHTVAFESESSRRTMELIAESKGGDHRFIPAPQRMNAPRRRAAAR